MYELKLIAAESDLCCCKNLWALYSVRRSVFVVLHNIFLYYDEITLKMSSFPDRLNPGVNRNAEQLLYRANIVFHERKVECQALPLLVSGLNEIALVNKFSYIM